MAPIFSSLKYQKRLFHASDISSYLLKDKRFYLPNPAEQIKNLPLSAYVYATLLASAPSMCHYTLRVLPNAFMIKFIFAQDPSTKKKWLVPEGFIGPKRHGQGYWLSCRYNVIDNFINEKKYISLDRGLSIRADLADHMITLFTIQIFNQLQVLSDKHFRNSRASNELNGNAMAQGNTLNSKESSNRKVDVVGAIFIFDSSKESEHVYKASSLNNYQSEIDFIPRYPLKNLVEPGVYKMICSLPTVQKFNPNDFNSKFEIEVIMSTETVPLLCTLYRLASYLNGK